MKTRIRDLREDKDIPQKAIAEYLKCDQSLYSKYELEKRDIPLYVIYELALFYNVSMDYIVRLTDNPAPYERKRSR
ncbi:MAG: helix-turn-helix transcriptional regulator [Clostridiales bacterium]|nr:helix-turn-helix transcriptional regulator [Clostridiales bacterium]